MARELGDVLHYFIPDASGQERRPPGAPEEQDPDELQVDQHVERAPGSEQLHASEPVRQLQRQQEERDDLEVRIRSARSVAYEHVEPILLACARAGIWNVTFAVYRRNE